MYEQGEGDGSAVPALVLVKVACSVCHTMTTASDLTKQGQETALRRLQRVLTQGAGEPLPVAGRSSVACGRCRESSVHARSTVQNWVQSSDTRTMYYSYKVIVLEDGQLSLIHI